MPWGRHDDKFHRSRKVKPLRRTLRGLAALGLRSILHSECLDDPELDGRVTVDDLRTTQEQQLCELLADAGLLDRDGDDYLIHDWGDYNPTKDGVERARNASRERVAKHRQRTRNSVTPALVADGKQVTPRARASGIPDPDPDPGMHACALRRDVVADRWHEAMHGEGGNPAGLHATRQWGDAYGTVVAGIAAAVPEEQRVLAAHALCQWFWRAPDGPVQSGRLPATRATPDHLAKRVSSDLEAASAWWADQEAGA